MNSAQPATSRRRFLQASGTLGSAAVLVGALDACGGENPNKRSGGGSSSASVDKNGTINAGISYELGTNGYDPMTTTAALTVAANWHTMEGLTEVMPTPDRKVYAALAKDLPKKVDDKTYEVTLRDDAKFHDGSDVTVDDVVFSFERVLDPKNDSLYASFIPFIKSVEKKNDHTVTINTKYPYSLVKERLAVVKIVPKAAVKKKGKKKFDSHPVGTGPYKMTDNGASSKTITFERFDGYNGPKPAKAKHMKWKIVPDESTRANALQSKSVQAIDAVPYQSIKTLESSDTVKSVQGFGLLFAMFNNGSKPFNEVKNRQAVLYAIDYDKVIKTGLKGQGAAPTSFLPENHPSYEKASTVYTHDPDKAKKLAKETGLKKMRMLCTDHDWVKKCTPIIKENLESAGIDVSFSQKQSADVYNSIDGKPDAFDLVLAPGDPSVFGNDADLLMRWWYSTSVWTKQRMHWEGTTAYKKVQKLLDQAVQTSGDEQQKIWGQVFDLLSEEVPLYPLFHRKTPTAWNDKTLDGFKPVSLTGLSFLNVGSTK